LPLGLVMGEVPPYIVMQSTHVMHQDTPDSLTICQHRITSVFLQQLIAVHITHNTFTG